MLGEGKVKRFLVLSGYEYYKAGLYDLAGSFASREDAETHARAYMARDNDRYAQILDLETGEWWNVSPRRK